MLGTALQDVENAEKTKFQTRAYTARTVAKAEMVRLANKETAETLFDFALVRGLGEGNALEVILKEHFGNSRIFQERHNLMLKFPNDKWPSVYPEFFESLRREVHDRIETIQRDQVTVSGFQTGLIYSILTNFTTWRRTQT
jgi:hypothetical protein